MSYGKLGLDLMVTSTGQTIGASSSATMKNRIINGGMVIDQRNNGGGVTPVSGQYLVDRWQYIATQGSKLAAQQNYGSVTPPVGFTNYQGFQSSSAYTVLAGDYFGVRQQIEGFNVADLSWGTSNAKTVTLSFLVYSSLTGTFGGSIGNADLSRTYPFSYSVPVANTWTTVLITIPGDTSGTWGKTNGIGIGVNFSMGTGSTFSGTAGSWAGSAYLSTTGATSVVGTSGATFYITGVQLEVGTEATSFDYRDYGRELMMCQRYYEVCNIDTNYLGITGSYISGFWYFKVTKRTSPTITLGTSSSGSVVDAYVDGTRAQSSSAGGSVNFGNAGTPSANSEL